MRVKESVAFVVYGEGEKILLVQRPADDELYPNLWSLPAGSLKGGETFEEAVLRSGREKLGVELEIVREIGELRRDKGDFEHFMREFEVRVVRGQVTVPQAVPGITQYQAWRWGVAEELRESARLGGLCSGIFLGSLGIGF